MNIKNILTKVDHTALKQITTFSDVKQLCDDASEYNLASVCIPASYVKDAKKYVQDKVQICTVIGFPNGYSTTKVKVFETQDALSNGADEIDMVINIGWVKEGNFDKVLNEIEQVKNVCGDKILKVIIETCLLNEGEIIELCKLVTKAKADYIKTSTGFSTSGATFEDIKLFKENVGENVKIKAAGGISTLEDAERFIELGADRLGTSRIISLVKKNVERG